MKILRVIRSLNPLGGGPSEGVRKLDNHIKLMGHTIDVLSLDAPDATFLDEYTGNKAYGIGPCKNYYGYSPKLKPWLEANVSKYDAVIVNGIWQYHSVAVHCVLAKRKVPYFVFTHGMLDPWFKHRYPLKHLKKWLFWPWAEYRLLRDARAVIFTSEEEKILARDSFWLYKCHEEVTNYGTDSAPDNADELKQSFLAKHSHLKGKRLVLFLSRIHEKKGCDLLIEAFARVAEQDANLHLIMAGPDQTGWQAKLQSLATKLDIGQRITWAGMLQGDLKWGAYYASEVFVLPSHQENFGIVVAEALACGKPVLISDKINIWREIEADRAGFVDEDTVEGTVSILNQWLSMSSSEYQQMSHNASDCFNSRFHIKGAATRLTEIIEGHID